MEAGLRSRPAHDDVGWVVWSLEAACLLAAAGLLLACGARLASASLLFRWWTPLVLLTAVFVADFASGIVHWIADTWGSDRLPVLGRRFLRPFRVHHLNPADILRRGFVDLNGDVAMLTLPLLVSGLLIPLSNAPGRLAAVFCVCLGACALPTNQIHQWAHRSDAPRWVRWLQQREIILSRERHALHHTPPHTTHYCITAGWCNPVLTATGFFPMLERWISRLTGLVPRGDGPVSAEIQSPLRNRSSEAAAGLRMER